MFSRCSALMISASVGLVVCLGCTDDQLDQNPPARPVTFVVLEEVSPTRQNQLTGSVDSWKKEMLSCRVSGRVEDVVEPGVNIDGRRIDAEGNVEQSGTLLAHLDDERYVLRRDEAAARLELSRARVNQAQTELQQAIPEQIKEAAADRDRKSSEFLRQQRLLEDNATSRSNVEQAENEFKQAEAVLAQAQIAQATKTAELAALNAQVTEAEQLLRQSEVDLGDCQLYSPFSGQISTVHAIAGSYLQEGMPVVTVQMMDPVKVELAVSQETDRRLRYNDQLNVYVNNTADPITGFVYFKDTVADAATRTFNITLLVRNRRIEVGLPEGQEQDFARTSDLFRLESENADGTPPFYTEEKTIHYDSDGRPFVWKVEGLKLADLRSEFDPVFTVRKTRVQLGEKKLPVLQLYQGRELTDMGDLNPGEDLVTSQLPPGVEDGDAVFLSRQEWFLRPGQLVHVELKGESVRSGFYVPRPAILRSDGKHFVFVAEDAEGGAQRAKRVEVEVGELFQDYRRIESVDDARLTGGARVILDGSHYLRDGESVNAFEEVEVSL